MEKIPGPIPPSPPTIPSLTVSGSGSSVSTHTTTSLAAAITSNSSWGTTLSVAGHPAKVEYNIGTGITIGCSVSYSLLGPAFLSLSHIHKMLPTVRGTITCTSPVTHILGLLLIEGVTNINIDNDGPIDKIMNKYLETKDVISAQDELLDAGFIEHAKL